MYPAVLDLFSENDFHRVNLREISSASGVSTRTIYKYFSSKEELLFSILHENISEIGDRVKKGLVGIEETKEVFRTLFNITMKFYDENPGVAITSFITVPMRTWMGEKSYRRDREAIFMKEIMVRARKRNDFDTSLSDRQISDLYYMFCYRHIHSWYYHGMKWKLAETISGFFDLFWKILKK